MQGTGKDPRPRRSNNEGSKPRQRSDGYWQSNYVAGYTPSGKPVRKSVYGKTKAKCAENLRKALNGVAAGTVSLERSPRLIEWLDYWLDSIAPTTATEKTVAGYRSKIDLHVRNHRVASKRLDKLRAADFDTIYNDMTAPKATIKGKRVQQTSMATAAGVHRILRRSLNIAVDRGLLAKNPMPKSGAPKGSAFAAQVYTTEEVKRMLRLALTLDDGARWMLNLTLGPRQSEALGLSWPDINFKEGRLRIERKLYTMPWQHGCGKGDANIATCGRKRGDKCPQRKDGGFFMGPTKSEAGWRTAPMPDELATLLKEHRQRQLLQRKDWKPFVDQDGQEHDLVFCRPNGQPLHGHSDWADWKAFLAMAGVPDGRVHDGRHTAATTLLLLGVPERVVMEILGWSQISMLARYQHVLDEMHKSVQSKLSAHLFEPEPPTDDPSPTNVVSLADRLKARRAGGEN